MILFVKVIKRALFIVISLLLFFKSSFSQPNERERRNLEAFSEIFGTVRYFYPSEVVKSIEWPVFAIYGTGKIIGAKNDQELLKELKILFKDIAPDLKLQSEKISKSDNGFKQYSGKNGIKMHWQHKGISELESNPYYQSVLVNSTVQESPFLQNHYSVINVAKIDFVDGRAGTKFKLMFDLSDKMNSDSLLLRNCFSYQDFEIVKVQRQIEDKKYWHFEIFGERKEQSRFFAFNLIFSKNNSKDRFFPKNVKLYIFNENKWAEENSLIIENEPRDQTIIPFGLELVENVTMRQPELFKSELSENIKFTNSVNGINYELPIFKYSSENNVQFIKDRPSIDSINSVLMDFMKNNDYSSRTTFIANWVIVMNNLKYGFPYWANIDMSFKEFQHKSLGFIFSNKNEFEHVDGLNKTLALLNDGHAKASLPYLVKRFFPPITINSHNGSFYVERTADTIYNKKIGSKILRINGISIDSLYKVTSLKVSGSRQWVHFWSLKELLSSSKQDTVVIELKQDDLSTENIKLVRNVTEKDYNEIMVKKIKPKNGRFKKDLFYFDLTSATIIDDFLSKFDSLNKDSKIIFDLRGYPKVELNTLLGFFLKQDTAISYFGTPLREHPDVKRFKFNFNSQKIRKENKPFLGKLYVLINEEAFSASETIICMFKDLTDAILVGHPTSGANGATQYFSLPYGYNISYTGQMARDLKGHVYFSTGIAPHHLIENISSMSFDEIIKKLDL